MNALYYKTLCTILWLDTEYFSKCCRSTENSMHEDHLHTVCIIHTACWYAILGSLQKKTLYSRHFLKHFDLLTALWRLPFEHVAVVGFWRWGELRQRRTAAAVCRKKWQISSDMIIQQTELDIAPWPTLWLDHWSVGLTFVSVVQHLVSGVWAAVMWAGWACGWGAGRQARAATGAPGHWWRLSVYATATASALLGRKRSPPSIRNLQRLSVSQRESLLTTVQQ